MDWITILISIIGCIGGIGGVVTLYHAKSNKTAIDVANFHALIEEERTERKILREEYEDYKQAVNKRVDEVKAEVAEMKAANMTMKAAIYSAYRCPLIQDIDDCIVIKTYKDLACGGCTRKYNNNDDVDYITNQERDAVNQEF